ncbi:hypothetical protein HYFRA_00009739 [Hymenoscyphus fraxineus]|uniref:Uncharacterized protein n=1 Tax=Hymenoscyphus fraxineus TaxID=746836 RepID=A0A9N9KW73_9HELO|nr:hypothetical protein HYFRA_00009739 [Hymenoscyphus fraxineus]
MDTRSRDPGGLRLSSHYPSANLTKCLPEDRVSLPDVIVELVRFLAGIYGSMKPQTTAQTPHFARRESVAFSKVVMPFPANSNLHEVKVPGGNVEKTRAFPLLNVTTHLLTDPRASEFYGEVALLTDLGAWHEKLTMTPHRPGENIEHQRMVWLERYKEQEFMLSTFTHAISTMPRLEAAQDRKKGARQTAN